MPKDLLILEFRRWFDEIKRLITSVEQADLVSTTKKISGLSKQDLIDTIEQGLTNHLSQINPHQDDNRYLNIFSKEEWTAIKESLVRLDDVPVVRIPSGTFIQTPTTISIEELGIRYRGLYYTVGAVELTLPTNTGSFPIALKAADGAIGEGPIFTVVIEQTPDYRDHYFLPFGSITRSSTSDSWVVVVEGCEMLGLTSVGSVPKGNRIPVSNGLPAVPNWIGNDWKP